MTILSFASNECDGGMMRSPPPALQCRNCSGGWGLARNAAQVPALVAFLADREQFFQPAVQFLDWIVAGPCAPMGWR